jgi:cyclophilin family peptidyl-prolyl cis-trans isomerase
MTWTALKGWLAVVAGGLASADCSKPPSPPPLEAGRDTGGASNSASEIAILGQAEDDRTAGNVSDAARTSHDVRIRRRAARALARIGDPESEGALLRALNDEDGETVGWGAYGLGFTCKGRDEPRVRALSARAASLETAGFEGDAGAPDGIDPRAAIARAVGRCGGVLAEHALVGWVRTHGPYSSPAAYGLGDLARGRGALSDEAASALLDAAQADPTELTSLPYLYPFGRVERVAEAFAPRVIDVARRALLRPSELRAFAIRALSRSGRDAAAELTRVVLSQDFTPSERAEASRGLSLLGEAGRAGWSEAVARLTPDHDPLAITALIGDEFNVLLGLLESLDGEAPKEASRALYALATLRAPGAVPPSLARRIVALRCSAASALANGAYESDVLKKCDMDEAGETAQRARLAALVRKPLVGDRRAAWRALAKSSYPRVREAALETIGRHPELADAARVALAEALASSAPGIVATAANVVQAHPDRAMVLAERDRKSALDPSSPPPAANPSHEIDRAVAAALGVALTRPWADDLIETRVSLLDAAAAIRLPSAYDASTKACKDSNITVREHATKSLRALGEAARTCAAPRSPPRADAGREAGREWDEAPPVPPGPIKVTFETDAGELSIVFDPELAPRTVARFVSLARNGFYAGVRVHRVVPGFVAQFGDPEGDGYGGSGALLRCETSPVPFGLLDVGVALAGRDTGSSQLFVTLARYPHLDGEYARVGHAEGDWAALADGDAIRDVKVED